MSRGLDLPRAGREETAAQGPWQARDRCIAVCNAHIFKHFCTASSSTPKITTTRPELPRGTAASGQGKKAEE